jgi:hypothetical protein
MNIQDSTINQVIDTLHNVPVKHIIDTIKVQTGDTMELIEKVDTFYNNAWGKLIVTFSGLGALIGVVFPYITSSYQKEAFKVSEERLNENFRNELERIKLEFSTIYEKKLVDLEKKMVTKLESRANHLQGSIENLSNNTPLSAYLFLLSVNGMLKGGEDSSHKIIPTLKKVISILESTDVNYFYKNANSGRVRFDDIMKEMRLNTKRPEVIKLLNEIEVLVKPIES